MSWREQCLIRLGEAATSLDALMKAMRDVTARLGFAYCSYIYRLPLPIVQPAVHWRRTYPAAWLERSEQTCGARFLVDAWVNYNLDLWTFTLGASDLNDAIAYPW